MQLIIEDLTRYATFPLIKGTHCYDEDWQSGKGKYSKKKYKLTSFKKVPTLKKARKD